MTRRVRLTEGRLRGLVRRAVTSVLRESKGKDKLSKSFKSKEDATMYRDMYAPDEYERIYDTDGDLYDTNHSDEGSWGSGPYKDYHYTTFADDYDYCGDDDYNDYASDYNHALKHRLSTKGGQMSYDWEHRFDNLEDAPILPDDKYDGIDALFGMRANGLRHEDENWDYLGKLAREDWINGASPEEMEKDTDFIKKIMDKIKPLR